ncbi:MAG: PGPGW domain-containing protein [Campylobacterota bacterium]|nr:PGPGW domain-containing protein [Campylobacterota bacterium]
MIAYVHDHEGLFLWLAIASGIGLIASVVLVPWLIVHVPSDYFSHQKRQKYQWNNQAPIAGLIFVFIKNVLGAVFVISGIVMLVLPGQGILAIVVGILLMDFPYKYKIESWIIKRPTILKSINLLRAKAKQSPLEV